MSKVITNHEYAQLLLSQEEKPLYSREYSDQMGESVINYYAVTGLDNNSIENAYIIETDFLEEEPNDKIYQKGDSVVMLFDENVETEDHKMHLNISVDNTLSMLLNESAHYQGWHIDYIGFYPDHLNKTARILDPVIKIATTTGFHPEWITLSLDNAKQWYRDNMENHVKDY